MKCIEHLGDVAAESLQKSFALSCATRVNGGQQGGDLGGLIQPKVMKDLDGAIGDSDLC
jgi:hypothetical protein